MLQVTSVRVMITLFSETVIKINSRCIQVERFTPLGVYPLRVAQFSVCVRSWCIYTKKCSAVCEYTVH